MLLIKSILARLTHIVPIIFYQRLISNAISARIFNSKPKQALQLLLEIDNTCYHLLGKHSIAYGQGKHIKESFTNYTDHMIELALMHKGPYLDVGCRWGHISGRLASKTSDTVCGVDIDEAVISVARATYRESNLHFEVGDATTINIAGVFNTIILSNVLEHIAERTAFLLKLRHVYNPNTILIRVPNFERDWRVPLKRELGIDYRLDKTHQIAL